MKVIKDRKKGTIAIHPNGDRGIYVAVQHGNAEFGEYGGSYILLNQDVATKLAKQILRKCQVTKH